MSDNRLMAQAHLACFSSDGRHLSAVIQHFAATEAWGKLADVLRIARRYGHVDGVTQIRALNRPELPVPDFLEWFRSHGVKWFDLYQDADAGVCFLKPEDAAAIRARAAALPEFWPTALAEAVADPHYPPERLALLRMLAAGEEPVVPAPPDPRRDVDLRFRRWCDAQGITVLKKLQTGSDDGKRCSYVYLALDRDGIAKVFKELLRHEGERLCAALELEPVLYARADGLSFLPQFHGVEDVDEGLQFLRLSYRYGQSLNDYVHPDTVLGTDEALHVLRGVAESLAAVHARGIAFLDLRPDNVLVDGEDVFLIDLNASRLAAPGQDIDAFILDPRFASPEVVLRLRASQASDVFQLGLLFHQLLTGRLPLVMDAPAFPPATDRERDVLAFALGNAVLPYTRRLDEERGDPRLAIIARMLEKDPARRPTAREVATWMADVPRVRLRQRRRTSARAEWSKTRVLFPARMGVPHQGHVDFIARLIEIGLSPIISLQRSYTLTERDPLPKWVVMKMVAQSLLDKGFAPTDFRFVFTPFFGTDEAHRLHFAVMPGRDEIVAVASGNPAVADLFSGLPLFDQRTVFQVEGEGFEDRSWGSIVRRAVVDNDVVTYRRFAASGNERVMPFEEIRRRYAETPVEFVRGQVRVLLTGEDGRSVVSGRVRRYLSPEESLVRLLQDAGSTAMVLDPYVRDTRIELNGRPAALRYERMELDGGGNETVRFLLIDA